MVGRQRKVAGVRCGGAAARVGCDAPEKVGRVGRLVQVKDGEGDEETKLGGAAWGWGDD